MFVFVGLGNDQLLILCFYACVCKRSFDILLVKLVSPMFDNENPRLVETSVHDLPPDAMMSAFLWVPAIAVVVGLNVAVSCSMCHLINTSIHFAPLGCCGKWACWHLSVQWCLYLVHTAQPASCTPWNSCTSVAPSSSQSTLPAGGLLADMKTLTTTTGSVKYDQKRPVDQKVIKWW